MARKKRGAVALDLRIAPEVKAIARRLARGGRRSVNNLIEGLIMREAKRLDVKPSARRKAKR